MVDRQKFPTSQAQSLAFPADVSQAESDVEDHSLNPLGAIDSQSRYDDSIWADSGDGTSLIHSQYLPLV